MALLGARQASAVGMNPAHTLLQLQQPQHLSPCSFFGLGMPLGLMAPILVHKAVAPTSHRPRQIWHLLKVQKTNSVDERHKGQEPTTRQRWW